MQRPGLRGQCDVASGDEKCAIWNWSIRNDSEGFRSEPSFAPSSPVSHSAAHIIRKMLG